MPLHSLQTNYTSGELDPLLRVRSDTRHYFNGAEYMRNVTVLPQGAARRRPGSLFIGAISPKVTKLDLTAGGIVVTAPNGGTAGNAVDDNSATDLITSTPGTTSNFVIVHVDLLAATEILFADVRGLRVTAGAVTSDEELRIQYSTDNAVWNDLGDPFDSVGTADAQRRRSGPQTARYWRLVRVGDTDMGANAFAVDEFWLWAPQTGVLSNGRLLGFSFSTVQNYLMLVTDQNIAVYQDGVYQNDIYIPHTSDQIVNLGWEQSLDTMLLFHKTIRTHEIMRQGANDEWNDELVTFTNMPQFTFDTSPEDYWSDTRGWPQCAAFFGGRLWMGGSDQRPNGFIGSKVGFPFDLDVGTSLDDEAYVGALDPEDGIPEIMQINSGRNLQFFTGADERYETTDTDPITPDTINVRKTTNVGVKGPGIPVYNVEGGVMFIQRAGKSVREFVFTDLEAAYEANPIALLSAHLIDDPVDFSYRKATSTSEGNLLTCVNTNGSAAMLQTLRKQEITAWTLWESEGLYKATGVDFEEIYTIVEYNIPGLGNVRYLERFDEDCLTDSCVKYTSGFPTSVLTGLEHLEGQTVRINADGVTLADAVVVGGQVTTSEVVETVAEVGIAFPDVKEKEYARLIASGISASNAGFKIWGDKSKSTGDGDEVWIRDMPVEGELPDGTMVGRKKRVVDLTLPVLETVSLYAGANGRSPQLVPTRNFGLELLDQPAPVITGDIEIKGIKGYSTKGQVELTQRTATAFTSLGIAKEVQI